MSNSKFKNKYRISSARAEWHDYSGGNYFVTICTAEQKRYFGEIVDGEMRLSEIGKYADECVRKIEELHPDVSVPLYVVMPNHIHLIVCVGVVETSYYGVSAEMPAEETPRCDVSTETFIDETPRCDVSTNEKMQSIARKCGRLSHVISRYKSVVTRYANENDISFKWQTRFYDRIIRNQKEINETVEYIVNNPRKWEVDEYY